MSIVKKKYSMPIVESIFLDKGIVLFQESPPDFPTSAAVKETDRPTFPASVSPSSTNNPFGNSRPDYGDM